MGSRNGGIRNLSMKKFGTPTAAGPTVASETVGLLGVGVPFERVRGRVGSGAGFGADFGAGGASTRWSPRRRFKPHPPLEVEALPLLLEVFELRQPSPWSAWLARLRLCARGRSGVAVGVAAGASVMGAAAGVLVAVCSGAGAASPG